PGLLSLTTRRAHPPAPLLLVGRPPRLIAAPGRGCYRFAVHATARRRSAALFPESARVLQVTRKDGEDGEALLRRFNKLVQRDGVLQEARRRRHFISNREKQRQAERRAARRRRRSAIKARPR
ncbi:MAG: 30S ribosomal protein S21, partial [Chloroflexota bacterium]|nr:30S ribosomal protein S21 [Chloroflexota bacterium]